MSGQGLQFTQFARKSRTSKRRARRIAEVERLAFGAAEQIVCLQNSKSEQASSKHVPAISGRADEKCLTSGLMISGDAASSQPDRSSEQWRSASDRADEKNLGSEPGAANQPANRPKRAKAKQLEHAIWDTNATPDGSEDADASPLVALFGEPEADPRSSALMPRLLRVDAEHEFRLGLEHERKNIARAFRHFQNADRLGFAAASGHYSDFLVAGLSLVPIDAVSAFDKVQRAFQAGVKFMAARLAWCYQQGFGVVADRQEAQRLNELERDVDAFAAVQLALLAPSSIEAARVQSAAQQLHDLADRGDFRAQHLYAELLFRDGHADGAVGFWTDAAERKFASSESTHGHAWSQYALGLCYEAGRGVGASAEKAASWYHKAAAQGHMLAQFKVGNLFERGIGLRRSSIPGNNRNLAIDFYTRAALQGHAESQFRLSELSDSVRWLQAAADQGLACAQNELARRFHAGCGVDHDIQAAAKWYAAAAAQGNKEAMFQLAICYAHGHGVEEDRKAAVSLFQQAAELGHAGAQTNLGLCFSNGFVVSADHEVAVRWFRDAAAQGNAEALNCLAACFQAGRGVDRDLQQAAKAFRAAAELGLRQAQFNWATCLELGEGVKKDMTAAAVWYERAAAQGDVDAQFSVGSCYEAGIGVKANDEKALSWYRKAAAQGHVVALLALGRAYDRVGETKLSTRFYAAAAEKGNKDAQCLLGWCCEHGIGTAIDVPAAVAWYQRAADQGSPVAQCNLACCLLEGKGLPQNRTAAVALLERAASAGIARAQFQLGQQLLRGGNGIEQNCQAAVALLRQAAAQGDADAQFALGLCLLEGIGANSDHKLAAEMFSLATDQGHSHAARRLGLCYQQGVGVPRDSAKAAECFGLAAEDQDAESRYQLALQMANGDGVDMDEQAARQIMQLAAEAEHIGAQFRLGMWYRSAADELSRTQAIKWLTAAAVQGLDEAMYELSMLLLQSTVDSDHASAKEWCARGAQLGFAPAQELLGRLLSAGIGCTRNSQASAEAYRMAAEQGRSEAQFRLGECFARGDGVAADDAVAVQWFAKAASQGHGQASLKLGEHYEFGIGCQQNEAKALQLYDAAARSLPKDFQHEAVQAKLELVNRKQQRRTRADAGNPQAQWKVSMQLHEEGKAADALRYARKAADQKHTDAACFVGNQLEFSNVVDFQQAAHYFQIGAEEGHAECQFRFGRCLYFGIGVEQDYNEAVRYLSASKLPAASALLGRCCMLGVGGLPHDLAKADELLGAAGKSDVSSIASLRSCCHAAADMQLKTSFELQEPQPWEDSARFDPPDAKLSFKLLLDAANSNHTGALFHLGCRLNIEGDMQQALQRMTIAAEQKHPAAELFVGLQSRADTAGLLRLGALACSAKSMCTRDEERTVLAGTMRMLAENAAAAGSEALLTGSMVEAEQLFRVAAEHGSDDGNFYLAVKQLQTKEPSPSSRKMAQELFQRVSTPSRAKWVKLGIALCFPTPQGVSAALQSFSASSKAAASNLDALHLAQITATEQKDALVAFLLTTPWPFAADRLSSTIDCKPAITALPVLFAASHLSKLTIRSWPVSDMSQFAASASRLQELNLECAFDTLPTGLELLASLTSLSVTNTGITTLPPNLLHKLSKLKAFNASRNKISNVPSQLLESPVLQSLDLSSNLIVRVGSENKNATDLKSPPALQQLNFANNQLIEVPPAVIGCANLQCLNMSNNPELAELPWALGQLKHLNDLLLDGCKGLTGATLDRAQKKQLLAYLRAGHESKHRSKDLKLIFLGNGLVGKTSLVKALQNLPNVTWLERNIIGRMINTKRTRSVMITTDWKYERACRTVFREDNVLVAESDLNWQIRDFPGQVSFASVNLMFLDVASSVVVVCISLADDVQECQRQLSLWLSSLTAVRMAGCDMVSVIVVGTHNDNATAEAKRWFDELEMNFSVRKPFPRVRVHKFQRICTADPSAVLNVRNAIEFAGRSLVTDHPLSFYQLRDKVRQWAGERFLMREQDFAKRLQLEFTGQLENARDYLISVGDIIYIPHMQTVLLNLAVISDLLGRAVEPQADSPETEGFQGVPVSHGVVEAQHLLEHLRPTIASLKPTPLESDVLTLLKDFEALSPVDAEGKMGGRLFVPSRLGEGLTPSQQREKSEKFRKSRRAALAERSGCQQLVRRFVVRQAEIPADAKSASLKLGQWSVIPPGFLPHLMMACYKLVQHDNNLFWCLNEFALRFTVLSTAQQSDSAADVKSVDLSTSRDYVEVDALVELDPDSGFFDVTVVSQDASAGLWQIKDCIDSLVKDEKARWRSLPLDEFIVCPNCLCRPLRGPRSACQLVTDTALQTAKGDRICAANADCLIKPSLLLLRPRDTAPELPPLGPHQTLVARALPLRTATVDFTRLHRLTSQYLQATKSEPIRLCDADRRLDFVSRHFSARLAKNADDAHLVFTMWGETVEVVEHWRRLLDVCSMGLAPLLGTDAGRLPWQLVCSSCVRSRKLGKTAVLSIDDIGDVADSDEKERTFFCKYERKWHSLETVDPQPQPPIPAITPQSIRLWSAAQVRSLVVQLKPHYDRDLRALHRDLDGTALMDAKSVKHLVELGVPRDRCPFLLQLAQVLRGAHRTWLQQQKAVKGTVNNINVSGGIAAIDTSHSAFHQNNHLPTQGAGLPAIIRDHF